MVGGCVHQSSTSTEQPERGAGEGASGAWRVDGVVEALVVSNSRLSAKLVA